MSMPETPAADLRFQTASDQSLLVYFGDGIAPETHRQVVKMLRLLQSQPIAGVRDLHPAYASLLINFDCFTLAHDDLEAILRQYFDQMRDIPLPEPKHVEIPVCYGGEFGPDLAGVAAAHGIAASQVIDLHASAEYFVYFLGFAPGFGYLGGLPAEIATPRLATPRKRVPAGSVGIAGHQTAVYPFHTPGGWCLIGRTPVSLFRPDRQEMILLTIGDVVRFKPISAEQFAEMATS
jgi:inhibitor of KinA